MARRILLLLLLCLLPAAASGEESPTFPIPFEFQVDGLVLRVSGAEVTPDRRNFLAHVEVREVAGQEAMVHWQDWFAAVTADGTRMRPPTDVGADYGGGLQRCFGPRPLGAGKRVRLMIYWPLYPEERPVRLWIYGGALSQKSYR